MNEIAETAKNEITIENDKNIPDFFKIDEMPYRTNKRKLKPIQIWEILNRWGNEPLKLDEICMEYGSTECTIYELRDTFPQISELYTRAQRSRAELYISQVEKIIDDTSKDLYDNGKGLQANNAAVRRDELRAKMRIVLAEKLYPSKFGQKTQVENRNLNVNATVTIKSIHDLTSLDISSACAVSATD